MPIRLLAGVAPPLRRASRPGVEDGLVVVPVGKEQVALPGGREQGALEVPRRIGLNGVRLLRPDDEQVAGLGAAVGEVLDAHMAASPRFRGIRHASSWIGECAMVELAHVCPCDTSSILRWRSVLRGSV